jgi:Cys-Gly metallodipeptidase DUG1
MYAVMTCREYPTTLAAANHALLLTYYFPFAMPLFALRATVARSFLPRFSFSSRRPSLPLRRFYYGYISDSKMAPQLEPFFKQ